MSKKIREASGVAWIVPVRMTARHPGPNWLLGPASFDLREEVRCAMGGHLQNETPGAGIDAEERRRSWTPRTADLLFPHVSKEGSSEMCRWHLPVDGASLASLPLFSVELLTAPAARPAGSSSDLGVLIVHVAPSEQLEDLPALRDVLHENLRVATGRTALLDALGEIIGKSFSFHDLPGSREHLPSVYAITTLTRLDEGDDASLLLAREIATLTPSSAHGSTSADARIKRLQRTRGDLTELSDSQVALITGHGTVILGSSGEHFLPAETYVSTIYADAMAATILSEALLQDLARVSDGYVRSLRVGRDAGSVLELTIDLRTRLLWLRSTLLRITDTESRPTKRITERLGENLRLPGLLETVTEDIASLMELASLQHQLSAERASGRMDVMLAILTVVTLPLTIVYTGIDLVGGHNRSSTPWYWVATGAAVLTALALLAFHRARERLRRSGSVER